MLKFYPKALAYTKYVLYLCNVIRKTERCTQRPYKIQLSINYY